VEEADKSSSVTYSCDNCKVECRSKKSDYERKKKHFCSRLCYAKYKAEQKVLSKINFFNAHERRRNKIKIML
jgi:hypothetical protein